MSKLSFFFKSLFSVKDDFKYLRQALSNKQAITTPIPEYFWRYQICRITLFRSSFDKLPNFVKYNYCPLFHLSNFFVLLLPLTALCYLIRGITLLVTFLGCSILDLFKKGIDVIYDKLEEKKEIKQEKEKAAAAQLWEKQKVIVAHWHFPTLQMYQEHIKGKRSYDNWFGAWHYNKLFDHYRFNNTKYFYDYYVDFYKTFGSEHKSKYNELKDIYEQQEIACKAALERLKQIQEKKLEIQKAKKQKFEARLIQILNIIKPVTKFMLMAIGILIASIIVFWCAPFVPDVINGIVWVAKETFTWVWNLFAGISFSWDFVISVFKWSTIIVTGLAICFFLGVKLNKKLERYFLFEYKRLSEDKKTLSDKIFAKVMNGIAIPFIFLGKVFHGIYLFVKMFYSQNCPSIEPTSEKVEKSA